MAEPVNETTGTMIELSRAALLAGDIAVSAEFFSFETNAFTQPAVGLSRSDTRRFLPSYGGKGIFPEDPFQVLDQVGVERLIRMAMDEGRQAPPGLNAGTCGEPGSAPRLASFRNRGGRDHVPCSPSRVSITRLAAAHAALAQE